MKYTNLEELRKKCSEGDIEDIVRLAPRYTIEDGKLRFLRSNRVIYEIDIDKVTVDMANKVDHSCGCRPLRKDVDKGLLSWNKRIGGREL